MAAAGLVAELRLAGAGRADRAGARLQHGPGSGAAARVAQADAQVRINGSPLLPAINGNANFSYQRSGTGGRSGGSSFGSGGGRYFDSRSYTTGLQASYDLDFWGRNRATYQASEAVALSTRFDQETVALDRRDQRSPSTYFQLLVGLRTGSRSPAATSPTAERILGAYQCPAFGRHRQRRSTSRSRRRWSPTSGRLIPSLLEHHAEQQLARPRHPRPARPPERLNWSRAATLDQAAGSRTVNRRPAERFADNGGPDVAYAEALLVSEPTPISAPPGPRSCRPSRSRPRAG